MTISIWRYSHLTLAISSFIFILLASITGIILAFEPISQKIKPYHTENFNDVSLEEMIISFKKNYDEILDISIDHNQFVILKAINENGENIEVYANPKTSEILGKVEKPNDFFQWITTLHRSLFLHETGRFIIGLVSFLLLLITISGLAIVIQRQRGIKRFFTKIVKENFAQYYHTVLGRLSAVIIILIAATGTYLTLVKFEIFTEQKILHSIDFKVIKSEPKKELAEFDIFKNTLLTDVQKVEFPFSDDVEDYYTIQLKDRELIINQFTGEILSEVVYSKIKILNNLSLDLHTGRTNIIWAIILAIATANILFFVWSGFVITLKRRKNKLKNKYKKDECEIIILVGSENGSTIHYANLVQQEFIKNGKKTFISELNNYSVFPKAEHLIIMTATYGLGDSPTNASDFLKKIKETPQSNTIYFSVVGFGSKSYPDFCQFAFDVNNLLLSENWAKPFINIHTVNDKSPNDFIEWTTIWSKKSETPIKISPEILKVKSKPLQKFSVIEKTDVTHADGAFLIRLKPKKKIQFTSGDLFAIYPANDHRERFYSIGKIKNEIQLSVKLHQNGLGSSYLYNVNKGDTIEARLDYNIHFHLPKEAKNIVMISNGTGIAPFLGMIDENKNKAEIHLYCGFRDHNSYELYRKNIEKNLAEQKLKQLHLAYSREGNKQYVKDLVINDAELMVKTLKNKGVIMICGSLAMQEMVLEKLSIICTENNIKSIEFYKTNNQILTDCY